MLALCNVKLFLHIGAHFRSELVPALVLCQSAVLLCCSEGSLSLHIGLLVALGIPRRAVIVTPGNLCHVSLFLFSEAILFDLDEFLALVAQLPSESSLFLFVAHDLGTSVIRNHLRKHRIKVYISAQIFQ